MISSIHFELSLLEASQVTQSMSISQISLDYCIEVNAFDLAHKDLITDDFL